MQIFSEGLPGFKRRLIDGEQYIATVSGQSTGGGYWAPNYARFLVFKMGGTTTLPEPMSYTPPVLNPPANFGDAAVLAQGEAHSP